MTTERPDVLAPTEEVAPDTKQAGPDVCTDCGGTGQVGPERCEACRGTGRAEEKIVGA